jgi:hypothetical protein
MRKGFVKAAVAAALFLIGLPIAWAQQQYCRQLTVSDFQGVPNHNTTTIALTSCYIDLKYDVHARNGYYQLTFNVNLEMNKERSWIDRSRITSPEMLAYILKHEQGHYIINYFEQQELLREFSRTRFGADYETAVKEIFDRIQAKYLQLNTDYDEDTDHSQNRIQQASWDKYFHRRLEYMPPVRS